jgi:hypothetical protein
MYTQQHPHDVDTDFVGYPQAPTTLPSSSSLVPAPHATLLVPWQVHDGSYLTAGPSYMANYPQIQLGPAPIREATSSFHHEQTVSQSSPYTQREYQRTDIYHTANSQPNLRRPQFSNNRSVASTPPVLEIITTFPSTSPPSESTTLTTSPSSSQPQILELDLGCTSASNESPEPAPRKVNRKKPHIQLSPDQPATTLGKPRERVFLACTQW